MPFIAFLYQQITTISFILMILALASVWIKKNLWVWGSLGALSILSAFTAGLITSVAFIPLAILAAIFWGLQWNMQGLGRYLLVTAGFLISAALFYHILIGLSPPIELFGSDLNYGKLIAGLLLLGWPVSTLKNHIERTQFLKSSFPLALLGALFLVVLTLFLQTDAWHPRFSLNFFGWAIIYLFCTIIPEEALLRGFLQKEIFSLIGGGLKAHIGSILISGLLLSLFILTWINNPSTFPFIILAGFVYSTLYQITKNVETSILCRFIVSSLYFFLLPK